MKHVYAYLIPLLGIITLFFSCRSGKSQPDAYEKRQLIFGTGGGFMGTVEQFVLLDNGQLYLENTRTESFEPIGKISRGTCKKLFKRADTLELASARFMNPGNKYFFLEVKDPKNQNRITWGAKDAPIDPNFRLFYRELMELTRRNK